MTRTRKAARAEWTKHSNPLEWRAAIRGAACLVRRSQDLAAAKPWECSIHRDTAPVAKSTHATFWDAQRYAEAEA